MAKPAGKFTWATDLNFTSGDASGHPTKVSPPGWPDVAQGDVPGEPAAPEFHNIALNLVGQWMLWQYDGSSAGAADAHVLETDSDGATKVRAIQAIDGAGGFVEVSGETGITYRTGDVPDDNSDVETTDADSWLCANPTVSRNHDLLEATAANPPVEGQRASFARGSTGNFAIIFHREGVGGALATLTANTHCSFEVEWRSGRWIVSDTSIGVTLGADAGP